MCVDVDVVTFAWLNSTPRQLVVAVPSRWATMCSLHFSAQAAMVLLPLPYKHVVRGDLRDRWCPVSGPGQVPQTVLRGGRFGSCVAVAAAPHAVPRGSVWRWKHESILDLDSSPAGAAACKAHPCMPHRLLVQRAPGAPGDVFGQLQCSALAGTCGGTCCCCSGVGRGFCEAGTAAADATGVRDGTRIWLAGQPSCSHTCLSPVQQQVGLLWTAPWRSVPWWSGLSWLVLWWLGS